MDISKRVEDNIETKSTIRRLLHEAEELMYTDWKGVGAKVNEARRMYNQANMKDEILREEISLVSTVYAQTVKKQKSHNLTPYYSKV